MRRLTELDRQKTDFMATVSHELRTPLTSISGYLELLVDGDFGDVTDGQHVALDIIGRNATRLRGLIEDLLVLNQIEISGLQAVSEDVAVRDLLRTVTETMKPVAANGGVQLGLRRLPDDLVVRATGATSTARSSTSRRTPSSSPRRGAGELSSGRRTGRATRGGASRCATRASASPARTCRSCFRGSTGRGTRPPPPYRARASASPSSRRSWRTTAGAWASPRWRGRAPGGVHRPAPWSLRAPWPPSGGNARAPPCLGASLPHLAD